MHLMVTIFVDDISFLVEPRFMAVQDPAYEVLSTPAAIDAVAELAPRIHGDAHVPAILDRAIREGTVTLKDVSSEIPTNEPDLAMLSALRGSERSVVLAAIAAKRRNEAADLWVSCYSDDAIRIGNKLGVRTASPNIIKYAIRNAVRHEGLALDIAALRRHRTFGRLGVLAVFLGTIYVGVRAVAAARGIVAPTSSWAVALGALVLGLGLFLFRSRDRIRYGLAEIAFGCVLAATAFVSKSPGEHVSFVKLLQTLGGVYGIVRGLDNVGTGLKGTRYERWWEQVF
jgi:hypothetical protein